jgi:NAD-dependent dihydropyrimidine dehydrogenase PreA subunit
MSAPAPRGTRVVFLDLDGAASGQGERTQIVRALLEKGHEVSCVHGEDPTVLRSSDGRSAVVVGRFAGRRPLDSTADVRLIDLDTLEPASIPAAVDDLQAAPPAGSPWKPWFPVIDYSRCTNCMQCLSFCLFDVYGVSADRKIQVQNQSNCKTECPACSRVCPEVAIMFPKYRHGPINGEEVKADDVRREAMKVDISALLGGDIYSMLRDRSVKAKSRFSKERDDDRALTERQNCLVALKKQLDVPAEVLAALPSLEEIQAKAEAAAARAEQARAAIATPHAGS